MSIPLRDDVCKRIRRQSSICSRLTRIIPEVDNLKGILANHVFTTTTVCFKDSLQTFGDVYGPLYDVEGSIIEVRSDDDFKSDMSDMELEQATMAPSRWIEFCSSCAFEKQRFSEMPHSRTRMDSRFIVPGGRYLVTAGTSRGLSLSVGCVSTVTMTVECASAVRPPKI